MKSNETLYISKNLHCFLLPLLFFSLVLSFGVFFLLFFWGLFFFWWNQSTSNKYQNICPLFLFFCSFGIFCSFKIFCSFIVFALCFLLFFWVFCSFSWVLTMSTLYQNRRGEREWGPRDTPFLFFLHL